MIKLSGGQMVRLPGKDPVYVTKLWQDVNDMSTLLGTLVEIEGVRYTIRTVDYLAHPAPHPTGEDIGLVVVPS